MKYLVKAIKKVIDAKFSNKYSEKLLSFIKDQIGIDLAPLVHEKQTKPNTYLAVDMEADYFNPSKEYRLLRDLETKYKGGYFTIADNGGLGIALMYGPKIKGK